MEPKMSEVPPPGAVTPPKSGAPKVLGMLNIVFGALLIICGLCSGIYLITMRAMMPVLAATQQQVQDQVKAAQETERAEQLKQLDEQEQAATTDEEKQSIQNQRQAVQSAPVVVMPVMPDMSNMYGMNEPRVFGFFVTDMLTALATNVFLVISGVGLVGMKDWGRRLAIWIAGIKIGRLFVSQVVNIIAITPIMVKQSTEMMEQMMSQMPPGSGGGPPPGFGTQLASVYGVTFTLTAVGTFLIGSIYPGILLWMLTRPEAKAACRQT